MKGPLQLRDRRRGEGCGEEGILHLGVLGGEALQRGEAAQKTGLWGGGAWATCFDPCYG